MTKQYCTFLVADLYFGVEVVEVQEVLRSLALTRVPLAPAAVDGLINLRGQIVTVIDMRARLGLVARPEDASSRNVVIRTDDGPVSLLVDEIGDVIETAEADFERPPETLPVEAKQLIRGVYKLQNRLLLILDTARAVALEPTGR